MSKLKIFAGTSNPQLAESIAEHLGIKCGRIDINQFPCTEILCQYQENIRGSDIYLIQPTNGSQKKRTNDNFMELCIMIDAAKRASAAGITAVIPYFGYARQDRKDESRAPISAKLIANMLQAAGATRVMTMDLHAAQIQGFFDVPVDHLYFTPNLIKHLSGYDDLVFISPDTGAIKRTDHIAKKFEAPMAFISKIRVSATEVVQSGFTGDVDGKRAVIVDDLTESCGTLVGAAEICRSKGAREVITCVSHGCLTQQGIHRLEKAFEDKVIDRFITSDTVDCSTFQNIEGVTILSVASTFAKAIRCIHDNESVSALFQ